MKRRNIVTLMGGIITGALWNASQEDGIAAAAQFADSNISLPFRKLLKYYTIFVAHHNINPAN